MFTLYYCYNNLNNLNKNKNNVDVDIDIDDDGDDEDNNHLQYYYYSNTWYSSSYRRINNLTKIFMIIIIICFIKNINTNPTATTTIINTTEIEFNIGTETNLNNDVEPPTTTVLPNFETTTISKELISTIIEQITNNTDKKVTYDTRFDLKDDFIIDPYLPKCDPKTETLSECSNSCPATCEDLNRKPCKNFCWKGCECAEGFVRNYQWKCIRREDCPKCKINEHYKNCGPECEQTCETYQNSPTYCDHGFCKRGCFCNYGFVRSENGTCIPINECPNKCGLNEYWDVNGEPCIRTLENPRPKCLFEKSAPSCVCNTGFKRDPNTKQCVSITTEEIKCQLNETYSYCGSDCAMNCFDENKRIQCPTICKRGCFCKENYRRQYTTRRCVLPEDCNNNFNNNNNDNNANNETPVEFP